MSEETPKDLLNQARYHKKRLEAAKVLGDEEAQKVAATAMNIKLDEANRRADELNRERNKGS